MIVKLMADVEERSVAIRECGQEIVSLRRQLQQAADREREARQEVERLQHDVSAESEVRLLPPCCPCVSCRAVPLGAPRRWTQRALLPSRLASACCPSLWGL